MAASWPILYLLPPGPLRLTVCVTTGTLAFATWLLFTGEGREMSPDRLLKIG